MRTLMMIFLLFIASESYGASECNETNFEYTDFVISENGKYIVFISENSNCFAILDGNRNKFYHPIYKDSKWLDVKFDPKISISIDSKYLLLEFNSGESSRRIRIIDLSNMRSVYESTATSATWMKQGDGLIVVPNFALDDIAVAGKLTPGLIIYHPSTNTKTIMAKKYTFTGHLNVGNGSIVANSVTYKNGLVNFNTILCEIKSDTCDELPIKQASN